MTFKYLVSICLSSAACFQTPSTFPSYNCIDKVNSCTLYFRGAASLTCSQQYVVYVLGVASPVLALQQQIYPVKTKYIKILKPFKTITMPNTESHYRIIFRGLSILSIPSPVGPKCCSQTSNWH